MSENDIRLRCTQPAPVIMDGKPVVMPQESLVNLAAIRSHLELMALRQDRLLAGFWVDGKPVTTEEITQEGRAYREIKARSIGFWELGQELASSALTQLETLLERTRQAVLLVLINPWPVASRLAQELHADLRTLVVLISFLNELSGTQLSALMLGRNTMSNHLEEVATLCAHVEALELSKDNLALSDVLEQGFLPWLLELRQGLEHWGETP